MSAVIIIVLLPKENTDKILIMIIECAGIREIVYHLAYRLRVSDNEVFPELMTSYLDLIFKKVISFHSFVSGITSDSKTYIGSRI
jgi:hypothetical protein